VLIFKQTLLDWSFKWLYCVDLQTDSLGLIFQMTILCWSSNGLSWIDLLNGRFWIELLICCLVFGVTFVMPCAWNVSTIEISISKKILTIEWMIHCFCYQVFCQFGVKNWAVCFYWDIIKWIQTTQPTPTTQLSIITTITTTITATPVVCRCKCQWCRITSCCRSE